MLKLNFIKYEIHDDGIAFINLNNKPVNALNSKATLFIPAYNWDFCKGKIYDPKKTEPKTGSLAKAVMSRSDFVRTNNPIYSFFV